MSAAEDLQISVRPESSLGEIARSARNDMRAPAFSPFAPTPDATILVMLNPLDLAWVVSSRRSERSPPPSLEILGFTKDDMPRGQRSTPH